MKKVKRRSKTIAKAIAALLTFTLGGILSMEASSPLVRNFTRSFYGAGTQNWDIAQAPNGSMLFANTYGLLSYNSKSWAIYAVDNSSTVRAIYVDERSERIYVGASNDFGYFKDEEGSGTLKYTSLRNTINTTDTEFNEIWNIIPRGNTIWFQSDTKMFCYDGKKTSCFNTGKKITVTAPVNDIIYTAFIDGTMGIVKGNSIELLPGLDKAAPMRICAIMPLGEDKILLGTAFNGLLIYDGVAVKPYYTDIDNLLRESQIFCGTINEGKLVLGTVNDGVIIRDLNTGSNTVINMESGLQNNTVLRAKFDNFDNLWLGLDNGIDFVLTNSPIKSLFGNKITYGAGYASLLSGNTLYIGTNQGLYTAPYSRSDHRIDAREIKSALRGQVWHIDTIGGSLMVSSDAGLFQKRGNGFEILPQIPGAWSALELKHYPGHALVSTYQGFYLIKKGNDGRWEVLQKVKGYSDAGGQFFEDEDGNIWIAHWLKGIYRLKPTREYTSFDHVDLYDSTHGLPSDRGNAVLGYNNKVLISTVDGYFRYDAESNTMKKVNGYEPITTAGITTKVFMSPREEAWCVSPVKIAVATKGSDGSMSIDSISFRPLADKLIPGFEHFNFIDNSHIIVSSQEGFYTINTGERADRSLNNKVYISKVTANGDSVIYNDAVFKPGEEKRLSIPYSLNSIYIEFVAPEYRESDAVSYSYILEDYDATWSPYTHSGAKEYTKLSEGNYRFRVKAFNSYTGEISECSLELRIEAPWYRSTIAKIVYALIIIGICIMAWIIFKRYSRRAARVMEAKKEREMEMMKRKAREEALQKDYEIARLKSEQLEHDIRHKSGELSNITMNVIRKNEILLDIASQLTKIQEANGGNDAEQRKVDKQLEKIKVMIRENISHDDDWRNFTRNFDVVYENYMKRLLEKYPGLSPTEQKLCAYLKMGLSSKEIAPLLNISFRSVEMTRYRLRKKMGLGREVNLAEYLRNF